LYFPGGFSFSSYHHVICPVGGDSACVAKDVEVVPISYQIKHWSEVFIDQLSKDYDVKDVFDGKNLNSTIEVKDFQNLVRVVLDKDYDGSPDSLSREAVVHELMKIWADKTGKNLDEIAIIEMLIYTD